MLAALNLKYDSNEALDIIEKVMHEKMRAELDCTMDLAMTRGCFSGFDSDKEFVIHTDQSVGYYSIEEGCNTFYQTLLDVFPEQAERMIQCGRRNVSWSTIAPAGSVSILTQTSSGCEPVFMPYYMRRKKINPNEEGVRIDFTDQNGDNWMEFPVLHPKFKEWLETQYMSPGESSAMDWKNKEYIEKTFKDSPYYGATANDIDWHRRIQIQSILQKYTTNAISSTLNLPNNTSIDEVSNIYLESWENGLKGQTIYRDGCRTGVLVANPTKPESAFEYRDAPKRPKVLPCDVYNVMSNGENYHVFVGLMDDKPYEVFARRDDMKLGREEPTGILRKESKGIYSFDSEALHFDNIIMNMTHDQEAITRLISASLRHGTDIKFIVEQLQKTEGSLTSFSKVISRTLKRYIPDGSASTTQCRECGSKNVIFEEGCNKCLDCGSSKCG